MGHARRDSCESGRRFLIVELPGLDAWRLRMTVQRESSVLQDGRRDSTGRRARTCAEMERLSAAVIVNADDWGRDAATTNRSLECFQRGTVSSVSGMVFMEDSERAAALARLHGVDSGLHLNFTLAFSAASCSARLKEHQGKIARFLGAHRFASAVYHPGLAASFEYVVSRQLDEYERLYGAPARRVDGHHHMHLCANVVRQKLLPEGIIVRRNLSFRPGEKGTLNRFYRNHLDARIARRHRLTDYFFDLLPLEPPSRLVGILELADRFDVEVETHPIRDEEFRFLVDEGLSRYAGEVVISRGYVLRFCRQSDGFSTASLTQQALR
jgi:chitin disaccharide deacetylase